VDDHLLFYHELCLVVVILVWVLSMTVLPYIGLNNQIVGQIRSA